MGVDATIVVAVPFLLEQDAVRRAAVKMATAFGAHDFRIYRDSGQHALELVLDDEHYGVVRPKGGSLIECLTQQSYYGPNYERGYLPTILAQCDWLAREFPGAIVYYGGDTGAPLRPIADQLDELLAHWHGPESRAYYDRTYHGAQAARPTCDFCSTAGHPVEMSYLSGAPETADGREPLLEPHPAHGRSRPHARAIPAGDLPGTRCGRRALEARRRRARRCRADAATILLAPVAVRGGARALMPTVQLECATCGYRAKRKLREEVACRGIHETPSEPASCPKGHGLLRRTDGYDQERS